MKKPVLLSLAALCLLLGGCGLLDREYRKLEPHSYSYREEADEDALRASSYQDLVNGLLMLVEEHREEGRLHLYGENSLSTWELMENARTEIMEQTPAGAYALESLNWVSSSTRDYCQVEVMLTYRRTAEEEDAIIDASSSNAVYDLIPFALEENRQCLAVRFAHLEEEPEELIEKIWAIQAARAEEPAEGERPTPRLNEGGEESPAEREIPPEELWEVHLYPNNENAGIVEIFFW